MDIIHLGLSDTFNKFVDSDKASGILLIICTLSSLLVTNSSVGTTYASVWHANVGGLSLEHWVHYIDCSQSR